MALKAKWEVPLRKALAEDNKWGWEEVLEDHCEGLLNLQDETQGLRTLMMSFVQERQIEWFNRLLPFKPDLFLQDEIGQTVLHYAVVRPAPGVDVEVDDPHTIQAVFEAVGDSAAQERLLHIPDMYNTTVTMVAARFGRLSLLHYLIKTFPSVRAPEHLALMDSVENRTAKAWARANDHSECVELLARAEAGDWDASGAQTPDSRSISSHETKNELSVDALGAAAEQEEKNSAEWREAERNRVRAAVIAGSEGPTPPLPVDVSPVAKSPLSFGGIAMLLSPESAEKTHAETIARAKSLRPYPTRASHALPKLPVVSDKQPPPARPQTRSGPNIHGYSRLMEAVFRRDLTSAKALLMTTNRLLKSIGRGSSKMLSRCTVEGRTVAHYSVMRNLRLEPPEAQAQEEGTEEEEEEEEEKGDELCSADGPPNDFPELIQWLFTSHKVDFTRQTEDGTTPLMIAASNGYAGCVNQLLQIQAVQQLDHLRLRGLRGWTAHEQALIGGHFEVAKRIQEAVSAAEPRPPSPAVSDSGRRLLAAAREGSLEDVERLLAAGVTTEVRDDDFEATPLLWAVLTRKSVAVLEALTTAGANLSAVNRLGESAAHCAVSKPPGWSSRDADDPAFLRWLLEKEPSLATAVDASGNTVLLTAAMYGRTTLCQELLKHEDVIQPEHLQRRGHLSKTVYDWAKHSSPDILELLPLEPFPQRQLPWASRK